MALAEIVLHQPTGVLYLACSTPSSRVAWVPALGRFNATGARNDYVATYDPASSQVTRLSLVNFADGRGLSLHGMDVVPSSSDPSVLFVFLVNHRPPPDERSASLVGADSSIEIFKTTIGSDSMTHVRTVEDPIIHTPNDLVGDPDGKSFFFTNDHGEKVGIVSLIRPSRPDALTFINSYADSISLGVPLPLLGIVMLGMAASMPYPICMETMELHAPKTILFTSPVR